MFAYLIGGLVLGGVYALTSSSLVITYASTGVLNFAFGAEAFFVARLYYYLHVQHNWSIALAAVVCILFVGPILGAFTWFVVFRFLRVAETVVKIVATIGLSVAIPAVAVILFGNSQILTVPGLAPSPAKVFHIFGAAVTLDQVIVLSTVIVLGAAAALTIKFTDVGLRVRALVDSEALTSLSGTNPTPISLTVWASTTLVAGLAGILVAPFIGLSSDNFMFLVATSLAAVVAARLTSVVRAVVVGILLGVVGGIVQWAVPGGSLWASGILNSIPFVVIIAALAYYVRRGWAQESGTVGGFIDKAIAFEERRVDTGDLAQLISQVQDEAPAARELVSVAMGGSVHGGGMGLPEGHSLGPTGSFLPDEPLKPEEPNRRPTRSSFSSLLDSAGVFGVVAILVVALIPVLVGGVWVSIIGAGIAYGIAFLSYTLVTGEGGMIWLCQITFAGVGAIATAELATNHHWPVMAAVLAGGLVAAVLGVVVGWLTVRLGDLYIAIATLTFGVLMDNVVFSLNVFYQYGQGIAVNRPDFANGDLTLLYVVLGIFCVLALLIVNLRRSTTGLVFAAVRAGEHGAASIGISTVQMKVFIGGIGAFVAGIGGGLLAVYSTGAITTNYSTLLGLTWLAVLVTVGVRSNVAALVAGISLSLVPALFNAYLPSSLAEVPQALFGLGAVLVVRHPEGTVVAAANDVKVAARRVRHRILQHA